MNEVAFGKNILQSGNAPQKLASEGSVGRAGALRIGVIFTLGKINLIYYRIYL